MNTPASSSTPSADPTDKPAARFVSGDPYALDPSATKNPPVGWLASSKFFGPGLVVSASIVGAGELITTTALGAEAGFILLWLVFFSTIIKVAVQVEMARYSIVTGEGAIEGYNRVPPRFGRVSWVFLMWALMALSKLIQTGGVVGGLAAALSILMPLGFEPLSFASVGIWAVAVTVIAIATLITNRYGLIENVAVFLTIAFVAVVVLVVTALPFTEFAYTAGDVASGLSLQLPLGAIGIALTMFGMTGVASEEITAYTYWCLEKGYARWAGPNDGSEEYRRRARGWISVMQKDAMFSWIVYTVSTAAFYVLGAAVLHPQGLVPEGNETISILSNTFASVFGEPGRIIFLIGAVAALGSTMWAAIPSWSRSWANALALVGVFDWTDSHRRNRWMQVFIVLLPILWLATFFWIDSIMVMIMVGGIAGGIFVAGVAVSALYLRGRIEPELRSGRFLHIALIVSSIAIILLGIYSAVTALQP